MLHLFALATTVSHGFGDEVGADAATGDNDLLIVYRRDDANAQPAASQAKDGATAQPGAESAKTAWDAGTNDLRRAAMAFAEPRPVDQENPASPPASPPRAVEESFAASPTVGAKPLPTASPPTAVEPGQVSTAAPAANPFESDRYAMPRAAAGGAPGGMPAAGTTVAATPLGGELAATPAAATTEDLGLKLAPRSSSVVPEAATNSPSQRAAALLGMARSKLASFSTTGGAVALVVGLFLCTAWFLRKGTKRPSGLLPAEAFAVLGKAPLAGGSVAHLLRLGNKLVLVSAAEGGVQTLSEVTDPLEVDRLSSLCLGKQPQSSTAEFQQVLAQLAKEPARGFLGRESGRR
jgi:flagellar biogenesis protein FliO